MAIYGIDLGTSNCLASILDEQVDGTFLARCLKDSKGNESFPSVVHFLDEERYEVGDKAVDGLNNNPDASVELIKIRLGKESEVPVKINGKTIYHSPQKISSMILRHFNTVHNNKINKAVITVPANFDISQKDPTLQSGRLSNIEIVDMIAEPSAAIMYHLFSEYKSGRSIEQIVGNGKNILVFDFGGGTLDLSIVNVQKDKSGNINPKVEVVHGDNDLGGNLVDFIFTKEIIDFLKEDYSSDKFIREVKEAYDYYYLNYIENGKLRFNDGTSREVKKFISQLKKSLEKAKIELSNNLEASIDMPGRYDSFDISRESFEEILSESNVPKRIIAAMEMLKKKNDKNLVINEVIMVGGTSQIPYIKKILESKFKELKGKIFYSKEYHNSISKGAAILGAIIDGKIIPPFGTNRCKNIVPHNLVVQHDNEEKLFIKYGEACPFTERKNYSLKVKFALDTNINIKFIEEYESNNETLKKIIKDLSFFHPCFYAGDEIEINMDADEMGLYKFTAIHSETKEEVGFEAEKLFSLSEEEIKKTKEELQLMKDITL